jgi:hypothetical protein
MPAPYYFVQLIIQVGILAALVWLAYNLFRILRDKEIKRMMDDETGPIEVQAVSREPAKANVPNLLLSEAPMCEGVTLREWLINYHPLKDNVWPAVVAEFYNRARDVPEVASYFHKVLAVPGGMEKLQQHFTRALSMVTGQGVRQTTVDYIVDKHKDVRDEQGRPIDEAIWNMVVSTLIAILVEQKVPAEGINNLGKSLEPIRVAVLNG